MNTEQSSTSTAGDRIDQLLAACDKLAFLGIAAAALDPGELTLSGSSAGGLMRILWDIEADVRQVADATPRPAPRKAPTEEEVREGMRAVIEQVAAEQKAAAAN